MDSRRVGGRKAEEMCTPRGALARRRRRGMIKAGVKKLRVQFAKVKARKEKMAKEAKEVRKRRSAAPAPAHHPPPPQAQAPPQPQPAHPAAPAPALPPTLDDKIATLQDAIIATHARVLDPDPDDEMSELERMTLTLGALVGQVTVMAALTLREVRSVKQELAGVKRELRRLGG
ncbi:hypothetical protein EIP91_009087 [Steccherinum ochraceum]|uniref:Uncharacterized protein n=1 Tax=Steccherinum ochraceum TaxID=92696 RepID=A0A4R0S019_9APHY|nr:hypothetical protein EIP91_009087 [Steccherinum ochraceum]